MLELLHYNTTVWPASDSQPFIYLAGRRHGACHRRRPTGQQADSTSITSSAQLCRLDQVDDAGEVDDTGRFLRRSIFYAARRDPTFLLCHSILLDA